LYTGVTNDLKRRMYEHKNKLIPGFTSKYGITKLVYFQETDDISAANSREKQLKRWHRNWKINLIETENKNWEDLTSGWFSDAETSSA